MKKLYVLAIAIFYNPIISLCQKINAVELCNETHSLYYYGRATSSIRYFLLKGDLSILDEVNFSDRNKLNNNYLLSLFKKFDSVFKKYELTELPPSSNTKVSIGKGLWHETNYFYVDKKINREVQVMQVFVLFEGDNAETEKENPKVKDIVLRLGKAIIDRKAYLKNYKAVEAPPRL